MPISANNPVTLSVEAGDSGSMLVQVIGFEVAFESCVLDAHGQILNAARLPYIRTGPVYQLLEANQASGGVEVKVSAIHLTKNAVVSIKVYQLPQGGRANRLVEQAYRLYSNSIQSTNSEAVDLWRTRVNELQQAASLFRRTGLEEQALWSEYLGAYFTYFPVSEHQSASVLAQAVQTLASEAGFNKLALMAMQLQGQALIERNVSDTPARAATKLKEAQELFIRSAALAERQNMHFEQAWAINNRGIAYYYQESLEQALEQYRQVLPIALELQDDYLVNLARGNIAIVNEKLGEYEGALGALLAIKKEWAHRDLPAERALNLADIGRLYSKLFLFPEAIGALSEAMELARGLDSKESVGRIGLSVAMAYHDMGQRQRARNILLAAIDDLEDAHYGRGLRNAHGLLADMHRFDGVYDQMKFFREQQRQYLRSDREHADFLFSQGLDALTMGSLVQAGDWFTASHDAAVEIENTSLQIRSLLQRCALVLATAMDEVACDSARLEVMLNGWLPRAAPRFALDARFSWAQLLAGQGDDQRVFTVLNDLVEDIQLYRSRLPGVLGAWYWESREKVFAAYMDLVMKNAQSPQKMAHALVKLDQLRNLENSKRSDGGALSDPTATDRVEEIRVLLARMPVSGDVTERQELGQAIDQELMALGSGNGNEVAQDEHLLDSLASLPPDTAYLTYHLSGSDGWAWIATRQGVKLVRLGDAKSIQALLEKVRNSFRVVGDAGLDQHLEELGTLLLGPLETSLPPTVYLGSAGVLAGFPFETVRHNGKYLVEDHVVINVLSLVGLSEIASPTGKSGQWESIFLAGAPTVNGNDLVALAGAESEIEDIARLFEKYSVHKFSGQNLQRASFSEPVFSEADLIHIASHGSINLEYPELSHLVLSGGANHDGYDYLTPLDTRQATIKAGLVVLSACETAGMNTFSFDSNLGFVSEFLQAGADAVVATLWPVPDRHTRDFMLDFYSTALNGVTIPEALTLTKRRYMNAAQPEGVRSWAAYQIYID